MLTVSSVYIKYVLKRSLIHFLLCSGDSNESDGEYFRKYDAKMGDFT